ncbi:MAG: bifunctional glutamate N-acetyltransferase/amino-acid acetyltransferase ArgJ [Coriobacteriales bacterium]|jgi:glutamate N-acetyltransferase/amino-acid N-acetyltransferase|nr:bifunctional glutamate N-acetyltransferase/amino-acid acetyltransferase ArgJ [Coriobacteriales bacterium]
MHDKDDIRAIDGGLGAVKGVQCAGISAGFRRNPNRKDMAVVCVPEGSTAAGVFTRNAFCAAPVTLCREHLVWQREHDKYARVIVLNSGNANAATGCAGRGTANSTSRIAADKFDCEPQQVLVASTGVIGVPLSTECFESGMPKAAGVLSPGDACDADIAAAHAAAEAIMTTDTHAKEAAVGFSVQTCGDVASENMDGSITYHVGGMAKGSGMIQPDMATMLSVIATDAPVSAEALDAALREAVNVSFNKVTVDSDTSTNDSVFILATGAAGGARIDAGTATYEAFANALKAVCEDLARQIAADGEGATKLVTVYVQGAANDADADKAARAVANSPLVKTAIAGHDANWGRIAMALGKSGAAFKQEDVDIELMDMLVCEHGLSVEFDEDEALRRFNERDEIVINARLGAGDSNARIWTCDLTHEYITINGDYRT